MSALSIGCRPEKSAPAPQAIDFFDRRELIGAPAAEIEFEPLETEAERVKIGLESRRAVAFPLDKPILVQIPEVTEGARFTCAVALETPRDLVPDAWFTFSRSTPAGVESLLYTEPFRARSPETWHDVSLDLSEFAGRKIMLRIRPSALNQQVKAYLANPRLVVTGDSKRKRVIVICIDTLRADKVGCFGSQEGLTPVLDSFAQEAVRFANCESASPWTLPSCAAVITGRYPGLMAADSTSEVLRDAETTLAELFHAAGWRTAAVTNNHYVSADVGFFQGVEYQRESPKAPANEQLTAAADWVKLHAGEDFYLYVHLFDPHVPYTPPEPFLSRFSRGSGRFPTEFASPNEVRSGELVLTDGEKEQIEGLYDGAVAFADDELGKFFGQLKALGVWDTSAVVIFADHGEEFWDHGGYEHGHTVYEELTHVPLLVKLPGVTASVKEDRVSLVDVFPTVVKWAGLEVPGAVVGLDLLSPPPPEAQPRTMLVEGCIHSTEKKAFIQGDWKQILYFGEDLPPELYNLKDDPQERQNLFTREKQLGEELSSQLLMYSIQTSEGCHARLYPLEGVRNVTYELGATVEGGAFSDIVVGYKKGALVAEIKEPNRIVSQVMLETGGYIGIDFNVTPEDAEVTFTANIIENPVAEFPWYLGSADDPINASKLTMSILDPRIAMSYPQARRSTSTGAYVWSVPPSILAELENTLSPEARQELRALGYVQN